MLVVDFHMERGGNARDFKRRWTHSGSPLSCLSVEKLSLEFNHGQFITTMKEIEQAHWDYLDNHCSKYNFLPRMNFYKFMEELFLITGKKEEIPNVKSYYRKYDKYKKSLPTAGAIILNDNYHILLVKVYGSKVYSLPKGKSESGEELEDTAIREVQEETGLDLEYVIKGAPKDMKMFIKGTQFYIVESDEYIREFSGYNKNEICDIRWFSRDTIENKPTLFSKQTKTVIYRLCAEKWL